jgi:hypothetical protein
MGGLGEMQHQISHIIYAVFAVVVKLNVTAIRHIQEFILAYMA